MRVPNSTLHAVRTQLASMPAEAAADAHGAHAPTIEEIFAPGRHATALDPRTAIVKGSRGSGKSFWAGVLGDSTLRSAAAQAYPDLGLDRLRVAFGFTGLGGPTGVDREKLDLWLGKEPTLDDAKRVWWATVLRAMWIEPSQAPKWDELVRRAGDIEWREEQLTACENRLAGKREKLLVVYDALDTVAIDWPRRRLLTLALLEVVWASRAWNRIRLKLFLRPDQLEDDGLQFVELPKLRTGATSLAWGGTDLYGMVFSRLALGEGSSVFGDMLKKIGLAVPTTSSVLTRTWPVTHSEKYQRQVMDQIAGPFMASGPYGYKRGKTYDWPLNHLADASGEVSPRSFLALFIGAARTGEPLPGRVISAEGIKQGLRDASATRVDQLHQEFEWIKEVLEPLAGVRLPLQDQDVFDIWKESGTVKEALRDAKRKGYLPPFPGKGGEPELYQALERINVMFRRHDGRIDMPDLFRVAARLIKRGAVAPS